ncbi:MAG: M24 family metallopeptidase [Phycisphaerales bacterium]|nr:M24 family metallopeptidase [Phycisphaerales bacterium]
MTQPHRFVPIRSPRDIAGIDRAARLAWLAARQGVRAASPGQTTAELAEEVRDVILRGGGTPAFEGYRPAGAETPFPGVACLSVGEQAVHAPPGPRRLAPGDVLTIDVGVILDGWFGDVAESVTIPGDRGGGAELVAASRRVVAAGIRACRPGAWWSSVARTIRAAAAERELAVLAGYTGHGVGRALHEPPRADCQLRAGAAGDFPLLPGMVLTVEPILVAPGVGIERDADGWTVRTADGSPACHVERTVAVTRRGPRILGLPGTDSGFRRVYSHRSGGA